MAGRGGKKGGWKPKTGAMLLLQRSAEEVSDIHKYTRKAQVYEYATLM